MNTGQRIALIVVAVLVLVGGFVLAQGAGDDEGGSDDTTTAVRTVAADDTETAEGPGGEQAPATTQEQKPPPPRVETIRIKDNQLASGEPRTLRFEDGDTIRLRFESNVQAEVHIHGYDVYVQVPAGGTGRARFKADAQGVFEVEDHATGALLAKLEIRPS